ncbi:MAG: alpha/beta hydrolase [Terriglobia bacterium]
MISNLKTVRNAAVLGAAILVAAFWPRPAWAAGLDSRLECQAIPSSILGRSVNVCVALPSDYAASTSTRYPTLYFLHGLFENQTSWSDRGGQEVLNELLAKGDIGKFLVVLPDGGKSFYINSQDGHERYEDFFIQELVPAIDRKYRTMADRSARGISGTSMGGYGALHIAMDHPDVFGSASAHSPALIPKIPNPLPTEGRWGFYARVLQGPFGSPLNQTWFDKNNPLTLAEDPARFSPLKIYFDCGDHDRYGFQEGAELLHERLAAKGFHHEFALRSGDHGWSYLTQYLKYSLLFHWRQFEQAERTVAAHGGSGGTH